MKNIQNQNICTCGHEKKYHDPFCVICLDRGRTCKKFEPQNQSQDIPKNSGDIQEGAIPSPDFRGIFDTTDLEKEIRDELEKGITRNKVLPLDWAMDRIKPLLEKERQRLRTEVEKAIDDLNDRPLLPWIDAKEELKKRLLAKNEDSIF